MKSLLSIITVLFCFSASAQYYYKDIIGTQETADLIKSYTTNKVNRVVLTSYDADNTRSEDFYVMQTFDLNNRTLVTVTRSGDAEGSVLTSYADENGRVVKTVDSSSSLKSISLYQYNPSGMLQYVLSTTTDSSNKAFQQEEHIWEYENGKAKRMYRVKDKKDTAYISFTLDDRGNVAEENSTRKGVKAEPVYYYYDSNNRLTDIVRYNTKAKRLLPEYMFEYSSNNQVIQKITIPSNSSNYLIWRYQFDSRGLKTKEAIYNKQKQLTGKIEYQYSFAS